MEKPQQLQENQSLVWDCGSTLYDSFELKSFQRQLDSAITSRSLSMPHLPDRRAPPPPVSKKPSKMSRSLHRLLRSVFKSNKPNSSSVFQVEGKSQDGFYGIYEESGVLSTIPEVPEIDYVGLSPEIKIFGRRTASNRFTAASIGISCA